MIKTAAERQATYRKKRNSAGKDGNGKCRINTWVSTSDSLGLDRLARRYGVTNKGMLENLIEIADNNLLSTLDINTPEWDTHFGVTQ